MGVVSVNDHWRDLYEGEELTKYYVHPFDFSQMIDYKKIPFQDIDIKFYYISKNGEIMPSSHYSRKNIRKNYYIFEEEFIPFCLCYKDFWYPLIKNERRIVGFNCLDFEEWTEIKKKILINPREWERKIKSVGNAFDEKSKG